MQCGVQGERQSGVQRRPHLPLPRVLRGAQPAVHGPAARPLHGAALPAPGAGRGWREVQLLLHHPQHLHRLPHPHHHHLCCLQEGSAQVRLSWTIGNAQFKKYVYGLMIRSDYNKMMLNFALSLLFAFLLLIIIQVEFRFRLDYLYSA